MQDRPSAFRKLIIMEKPAPFKPKTYATLDFIECKKYLKEKYKDDPACGWMVTDRGQHFFWDWLVSKSELANEVYNGSHNWLSFDESEWGFLDEQAVYGHLDASASDDDYQEAYDIGIKNPKYYKEYTDAYPETAVIYLRLLKKEFGEHLDDDERLRFHFWW